MTMSFAAQEVTARRKLTRTEYERFLPLVSSSELTILA